MAGKYPFIAFCSQVLNSKTTRTTFLDAKKRTALFLKYKLSPAQKKAAKSFDIDAISYELRKEIAKAVNDAADDEPTSLSW